MLFSSAFFLLICWLNNPFIRVECFESVSVSILHCICTFKSFSIYFIHLGALMLGEYNCYISVRIVEFTFYQYPVSFWVSCNSFWLTAVLSVHFCSLLVTICTEHLIPLFTVSQSHSLIDTIWWDLVFYIFFIFYILFLYIF